MAKAVCRIFSVCIVLTCLTSGAFANGVLNFGSFDNHGLTGWKEKSFKGNTDYTIIKDGQRRVLQAKSNAAASGLIFETEYDPAEYPVLHWRWKIDNTNAKGDSRTKAGDDYAARVYVVFPHWFFPKTRTLNYIWANRLEKGAVTPNAYTGNAMMIAVESGPANAGTWVEVRRNIVEDFRRAFGEDPPKVGAIAIMTDTDNTGESATAWYGDITASRD